MSTQETSVSALLDQIVAKAPALVLLVGPPASGKSATADGLVHRGFDRLSMDAIRAELFGDESIYRDQDKVKALLVERYTAALAKKSNILLDNTNCNRKGRDKLIAQAREAGYEHIVLVVMMTPLATTLERNKQRSRVVPENIIRLMHGELNGKGRPDTSEGWIIEVRPGSDRDHVQVTFLNQK